MAKFFNIEEAREQSGMRLICGRGVPGPWAEAAKGIMDVKNVPYTRGEFVIGADHTALIAWTAQASVPVLAWNDEFPKSNWAEQLYLAERIAPEPQLIPADAAERRRLFGYANEICGMHGLGWSRRLVLIHDGLSNPDLPQENRAFLEAFGAKYGYSPQTGETASARVAGILGELCALLESQREQGSRYMIGDRLSALDIYWAGFSHLFELMPPDLCPMLDEFRPLYQTDNPQVRAATKPILIEHRDFIYREHLVLPMDL